MGDAQGQNRIRIGMIGTGRIANRFVPEARTVETVELTCVYNPNISSARSFAAAYGIEKATNRMEDFLPEVDAVYIAAPHAEHVSYTRQMLQAGKHVLCEKPLAFSAEEAGELFALADEKQLVLMEAIKTAYCPGFLGLLEKVQSGAIGEICDVEACFTKLSPSNVREIWDEQYGGSFPELGTYSLFPIVKILGMNDTGVLFQSIQMGNGKDGYTKAIISYPDAMATAKTGLSVKSEGQLLISGTKGYILAESPWWLTKKFEVRYEDPNRREVCVFPFEETGLRYEIREFAQRIVPTEGNTVGVTSEESVWLAKQMEAFLIYRSNVNAFEQGSNSLKGMTQNHFSQEPIRIWAHRGCSMRYPENTLDAFAAAAAIEGIAGIELDVQLTRDGELVVIHDETVDRTTDGHGEVRAFYLRELKGLKIKGMDGRTESIPTLEEVFKLLQTACRDRGLMINIELKNSKIRYEGMEEKVFALVEQYRLNANIIYSSFLPDSMALIKQLDPSAQTGILAGDALRCLKEMKRTHADAIHPCNAGLPLNGFDVRKIHGVPVRVWNSEEPFFGQERPLKETKLTKYAALGATDVITNVPEKYLY